MKKILFIEDDPSTLEVYKIALEEAGFEVEPIDSGEEALEKLKDISDGRASKPDLVLLDYILPEIDGLTVLKEIKKNPKIKDIKVLITTNYSVEALKQKGKFVKGEKFIIKADYPPRRMIELIKKEIGA